MIHPRDHDQLAVPDPGRGLPVGLQIIAPMDVRQERVMEREMPLKRIAQPEDIARAGLDISSWPDASGIVVLLDGGRIM